jgi:hypothetical protein
MFYFCPPVSSGVLWRPFASFRVLPCPFASFRVLPRPFMSFRVLPRPFMSFRVLPCPFGVLWRPPASFHVLWRLASFGVLPCPFGVLPCPLASSHVLSRPPTSFGVLSVCPSSQTIATSTLSRHARRALILPYCFQQPQPHFNLYFAYCGSTTTSLLVVPGVDHIITKQYLILTNWTHPTIGSLIPYNDHLLFKYKVRQ